MKALDIFNEKLEEIYNYFGFVEDWIVFPITDRRDMYWKITDGKVMYAEKKEKVGCEDLKYFSDELLNHRFYPKSIYEGKEFTMIIVDTHTDGNKFFAIYDNTKKIE